MLRWAFGTLIMFYSWTLSARVVTCTHIQVCNLATSISNEIKASIPEIPKGDPHLYSPTPESIKKYIEAELLIVAPIELNPWAQRIVFIREKQQRPTLVLKVHNTQNKVSAEANAHFWLNPENLCSVRDTVAQFLKAKVSACPYINKFSENILKIKEVSNYTFVIAHDALSTLFQSNDINFLALQGGGHDHEIGPKAIKDLYRLLKINKSIVWIEEPPIVFPKKIKSMMRKSDQQFELNVEGKLGESPDAILSKFFELIAEVKNEKN